MKQCFILLCQVKVLSSLLRARYLFLRFSFLLLLVELWGAFAESAVAWPLVFRWSNSLFLVGNSSLQATQRRFSSFWKGKQGKLHLNHSNCLTQRRTRRKEEKGSFGNTWNIIVRTSGNCSVCDLPLFDFPFAPPFWPFDISELLRKKMHAG